MIYLEDDVKINPCKCGGKPRFRTMYFDKRTLHFVQCESYGTATRVYYMPNKAVTEWKKLTSKKG